jgi:hypothetical protein
MLAQGIGLASRNQGLVGAGLGGAVGYMTGGAAGALVGAAGGGIGMKMGKWGSYREGGRLGAFQTKIGKRISEFAPGLAGQYGTSTITGAPKITPTGLDLSGMRKVGRAEAGGRALGGIAGGMALAGGVGALAGVGMTAASIPFKTVGTGFGSAVSATYGNSFSGMGNGSVSGY